MRIPDRILGEIMDRLDVVEVVSQYTKLEKKGGRYWGLCPFHTEKTPSFTVTPDKAVFYCFGCHKGGSIFTFIMEAEKLAFIEAVRLLAQKAGVEIEVQDEEAGRRNAYLELYRRLAGSLHYLLMNHPEASPARAYLAARGIQQDTLERFVAGYAPADRDWLYAFLKEKNFSQELLTGSGLFFTSRRGEPVSLFRDRIVFPIGNTRGEVVGFGGRSLSAQGPKYLNTPETAFFRKGELLFGEPGAFQNIRREGHFLLMEGYMDVLASSQAGLRHCIAPLGTALTHEQARLLKRFAPSGVLVFDADEAGRRAVQRALVQFEQLDMSVEVVELAGGKDPAEIMQKQGPEALQKSVKCSINGFRFLLKTARERYDSGTPEGKKAIIGFLYPYLSATDSQVKRDGYFRLLAEELGVDFESVKADYLRKAGREYTGPAAPGRERTSSGPTADYHFVLALAAHRDYFPRIRNLFAADDLEDGRAKKLFIALEECYRNEEASVEALLARIEEPELRGEILEKIGSGAFASDPERQIRDGLTSLRRRSLERQRNTVSARLAAAGEPQRLKELLAEKMHIDEELKKLKVSEDDRSSE